MSEYPCTVKAIEEFEELERKLEMAIDALEDYRDMPGWSCTKSTTKYSTATIALDKLKITERNEK